MISKVRQLWLDALRGGRYSQATKKLRTEDGFCCLGVLCDLSGTGKWEDDGVYRADLGYSNLVLPESVRSWAGLIGGDPGVHTDKHSPGKARVSLSDINDSGASFEEIADLIEAWL